MKPEPEYKINWSGRSKKYSESEVRTVVETMKNADPLTQGKYQKEFESKFSEYIGANHSFAVSSATAALELSAILCNFKEGDEVIIPAHTFCATAIPFARTKAKIVWADIDKDTRVVSAETISRCITPNTKAVVVVHLYGLIADMESIMRLARENNLLVIEDCAQAIGPELYGEKAGSFGDFGCFSFHCQKSVTTLGEGGVLTVKSNEHAKLIPGLKHNGCRPYNNETRERYWLPAMSSVDFDIHNFWPYNFCLGEVQCALGTESLKTIDEENNLRRQRAKKIIEALKDYPELSFQKVNSEKSHVYHLLSAKYDGQKYGKNRDDLMELMIYKYKIKTVVQYYPLYRYPMFIKAGCSENNCPNTNHFFDNMISFPFHLHMSEEDVDYLIDSIKKSLEELRNKKKVMGIIYARGGSQRLPKKNIRLLNNKPLIAWTIDAAKESKLLDDFFVSTEDPEIKRIAIENGAKVVDRPVELASNTATSLDLLKYHFADIETDVIVALQPTSPIRRPGLIDRCIREFLNSSADCLATGSLIDEGEWGTYNTQPKNFLCCNNIKGYFHDDGNVYIYKRPLIDQDTVFTENNIKVILSHEENIDVNYEFNFQMIEAIIQKHSKKPFPFTIENHEITIL
jgi:dTDP-4-amino-4,6-dideoxygalactose transaminase/CMP-N-acetylneuraminic acid synthetase